MQVMQSNHFILCHPLLLPSVFPSIRVFSNELALRIRQPKYCSFNVSSSNEYSGLLSFRLTGLISLLFKGLSRVFSSTTIRKHQFFGAQPSWSNSHRKAMTNLDSILLKAETSLFWQKSHIVKAMIFPVVMYRCESWIIKLDAVTVNEEPSPEGRKSPPWFSSSPESDERSCKCWEAMARVLNTHTNIRASKSTCLTDGTMFKVLTLDFHNDYLQFKV